MRYADCPAVRVSARTPATRDAVWALVSDIQTPAQFSAELQGSNWLGDATEPSLGARFEGRNAHPAIGDWSTVCTVTALEPGRLFEWSVGDPAFPSSVWRFALSDLEPGCELSLWFQMGPAPSGLTPAIESMPDKEERIVARRLGEHEANMQLTVDGIVALAETR